MRVCWSGSFFSNASLAIVNRRLVRALLDRGKVEVAVSGEPVHPDVLMPEFRSLAEHASFGPDEADITVLHNFPPQFAVPSRSRYVHIQPWEYGSMPREWYDALHDECDDIWAHANLNRDAYIEDGIDPARVAVIPHGVDLATFSPDGPKMTTTPAGFRFLFVGGTLDRKGIDALLNAYHRAFRRSDDVVLMIKDVNPQTLYRDSNRRDDILRLTQRVDMPRIEYTDGTFPDVAMAQLYRAADCFVLPYRGEGFGMPVLEAMACGRPVIVTAGGATDDFVDETVGWRIPSTRQNVNVVETVRQAWLLNPDVDALAASMRFAFEHRDEARRRGEVAAARARTWTWDRTAAIVEERLAHIMSRAPMPAVRRAERYRDPSFCAEQIFGDSRLDGIVLQVFRRLGVGRACFVELTEDNAIAAAPVLARGMRWTGIAIERRAGAAPERHRFYENSPQTQLLFEDFTAATLPATLRARGVEPELDLLSLGCPDAADAYDVLTGFRPRVIACAASVIRDVERRAGSAYARAACESERGETLLVREDLADRAGFTPTPATMRS